MIKSSYLNHIGTALIAFSLMGNAAIAAEPRNDNGQSMREEHASEVSNFVQGLTEIAGKDKNIGAEVSEVAKSQKDSEDLNGAAIEAIENRGGFKTFLIGTDYKNIGVIRSGLVTTENNIDRLTKALERTDDAQIKADLQKQINALKATQAKLENFVKVNESKFSLLGWLVRFLNR